jgi:hypothetical protein
MTIDYTSIRLLEAAVGPEMDRRAVNSDFPYRPTGFCWMARISPGHIFGRSHRVKASNNPIGSIFATGQPSNYRRTRHIDYHAYYFTSMVGFGAGSDHSTSQVGLSSCHANPTTWHPIQTNQRKQTTWRSAGYAQLCSQN